MYFNNNKSDTNIDKEFTHKKKGSSSIGEILKKYKFILLAAILILIVVVGIIVIATGGKKRLVLNGEAVMTIYQDTDYIEPGYKAYNKKNKDMSSSIIIKSTLDTSKIGEYEITYTFDGITKVRKVNVVAKPDEYTYIYLKTVNNEVNIHLKVGDKYEEPGYQVFNSAGNDLNAKVKITGTVDTSKKGTYKLIYSVVNSKDVTISVARIVIVE